jgi:flagellar biosynthetic protein FlhB
MAEKTEAPTPRRREEARAKGQGIGRSWEFTMGLTLGVSTLALSALLPGMARNMVVRTQATVLNLNPRASDAEVIGAVGDAIITVVILVLPLAGLVMIAGVAGNVISGGLVFSNRAIRFDLSRINPIAGLKRLADRQALVRLGLASAKLAILSVISWQVVGSRIPAIVNSQGSTTAEIAGTCLSSIFQLGLTITILLAVVALVDFVVQRRRAMESIKMTKEEVRQEYKESEGDPHIRGARKRRARQLAFARMMDAIPTSDVIVTNPTTLAVALKYDSLTMRAPKIVAKGQRLMAERIKQLAKDHRVPIVEDKPLARALFSRPVGAEVPAHLYRAVARLLVLVHQARFARAGARSDGGRGARTWTAEDARGTAAGLASRPWFVAADRRGSMGGEVIGNRNEADGAMAARLYGGRIEEGTGGDEPAMTRGEPPEMGNDVADVSGDPDEARLRPEEVDEAALAVAMANDPLKDLTADEMAAYEAEMALEEASGLVGDLDGEAGEDIREQNPDGAAGTRAADGDHQTADSRAETAAQAAVDDEERAR